MKVMPFELDEVLQSIRGHVKRAGSLRSLGRKWRVTPAYLSDILLGRRKPGPKVLKHMNLICERTVKVIYRYEDRP